MCKIFKLIYYIKSVPRLILKKKIVTFIFVNNNIFFLVNENCGLWDENLILE